MSSSACTGGGRRAAGGELEQCLSGLAWQVVREFEERVLGGGSRLVEPLWRHPVAEQVVVRNVVEEPRLGRRRRCGLSDGQLPRDVARHLDLADGLAHLDDLRGARARVALDHPALSPAVRRVMVVRVAEQQARVGPMHDQAQIAADARRPEVPVFALVDAVELRAGVRRVELQVEGRGLRRPLLVRGQPGEAGRERVGDPDSSISRTPFSAATVGRCGVPYPNAAGGGKFGGNPASLSERPCQGARRNGELARARSADQFTRPRSETIITRDPPGGDAPWISGRIELLVDRAHLGRQIAPVCIELEGRVEVAAARRQTEQP